MPLLPLPLPEISAYVKKNKSINSYNWYLNSYLLKNIVVVQLVLKKNICTKFYGGTISY